MSRTLARAALALGVLLFVGGCHQAKPAAHKLALSLDPPQLQSGVVLTLSARPEPPLELQWVSGTVEVMGAPTLPMSWDPEVQAWKFKSMVPPFVSIPAGTYTVRAWGQSSNGKRAEGELSVKVD